VPNKINHNKRIISEKIIPKKQIANHDLISFKYNTLDGYDKNPLVYVLPTKNLKGKISGINFNYLKEYVVQELLKENDIEIKNPSSVNLKKFNLYKNAFRTYKIDDMVSVKIVEYKTDKMLKEERDEN
tara:strand:- start:719 stop:1102 length:384 start_codon:yes stop_codon:yes gene_type:complete